MSDFRKVLLQLIDKCSKDEDKDEMLENLEKYMNKFPNYVSSVVHMVTAQPIYQARYEGQEFRDKYQELDERRRRYHESAIDACNILNRMCKMYGMEDKFFEGDTADRYQVADFCVEVTVTCFLDGQEHSKYNSIEELSGDNIRPQNKTISDMEKSLEKLIAEVDDAPDSNNIPIHNDISAHENNLEL